MQGQKGVYGAKRKAFLSGKKVLCDHHGLHSHWYYNPNYNQLTCRYCASIRSKNYGVKYPFRKFITWARRRQLPFNIDEQYIAQCYADQNGYCALSGTPLHEDRMSLDRIDSSKGYIRGNVQWVDRDINRMKTDLPEKIFVKMCRKVANHKQRKR